MTPYHFFISRAGEDRECAKWIASLLEAEGHTTTLQDDEFKPGQSFLHQMKLAEDRADHFLRHPGGAAGTARNRGHRPAYS